MKRNNILNYIFIVIGGIVAIYAQADEEQNTMVLIIGIVVLMFGIYRISSDIPSKFDANENENINPDDEKL